MELIHLLGKAKIPLDRAFRCATRSAGEHHEVSQKHYMVTFSKRKPWGKVDATNLKLQLCKCQQSRLLHTCTCMIRMLAHVYVSV